MQKRKKKLESRRTITISPGGRGREEKKVHSLTRGKRASTSLSKPRESHALRSTKRNEREAINLAITMSVVLSLFFLSYLYPRQPSTASTRVRPTEARSTNQSSQLLATPPQLRDMRVNLLRYFTPTLGLAIINGGHKPCFTFVSVKGFNREKSRLSLPLQSAAYLVDIMCIWHFRDL